MRRLRPGIIGGGSALVLLALFAAVSGCAQFKALFARQHAAPDTVGASAGRLPAVRPAGGSASAHYRLARFYVERNRHHEAMKEFKKAIEADPTHAKAWNGLGVSLDALGRYEDASQAYTEALRLDPSLDYVHNNLGSSLAQRGDHEAAAAAFQRAVELNPENAVARGNLARLSVPATAGVPVVAAAPETPEAPAQEPLMPSKQPLAAVSAPEPSVATSAAIPEQTLEATSVAANLPATAPAPPPPAVVTAAPVKAAPIAPPAPAVAEVKTPPPAQIAAAPAKSAVPIAIPAKAAPATAPAPTVVKAKALPAPPVSPITTIPVASAVHVATQVKAPPAVEAATIPKDAKPMRIAASAVPPPTGIVVSGAPDPLKPDTVRVRVVSAETLRRENPVELANESGSPTLLGAVTAGLAAKGYRVEAVKESRETKREKTMILYREGALQPAYQVAQAFPGYQEMKRTETFDKTDSSVRVLLGRDMEAHRKSFGATSAAR